VDLVATLGLASDAMVAPSQSLFVDHVCLPALRNAQNAGGGWGFHPGSVSRVEPTCWALQALLNTSGPATIEAVTQGFQFLRQAQLPDGSWPSTPGEKTGCWVTSLACWTLASAPDSTKKIAAGLSWLCEDWPRDSSPWRRLLRKFSAQRDIFPINDSYRGWGWTPHTSSWVEPSSFALLALEQAPKDSLPSIATRRRELAESMIRDRMCPGGGWNCGNPRVYGVAGEPLVIPTVWALLALRGPTARPENVMSLDWLERNVPKIQSPASLALSRICFDTYGRTWPAGAPELSALHAENQFLDSIQVTAWACLASGPRPSWLSLGAAKAI
jgi:hypothetical protein